MSYKTAALIHHISISTLADCQVRDHVPDELEVCFGGDDSRVLPRTGHGNRHVRLRFLTEVDRAEIGLACNCFLELRVAGEIEIAADDIHCQARNAQLLMPR